MKFTKEPYSKRGGISINYNTGSKTVVADEIGITLRIKAKCPACKKPRSVSERYTGFTNNGFVSLSYQEMMDRYTKQADARIEQLRLGESVLHCSKCGEVLV